MDLKNRLVIRKVTQLTEISKYVYGEYHRLTNVYFGGKGRTRRENQKVRDGGLETKYRHGYIVALIDGELVGACVLFISRERFEGKKITIGFRAGTFVREEYRRQGIGTKIVKYSMKYLRDKVDIVFSYTSKDAFFEKCGCVKVGLYAFVGKSGRVYIEDNGFVSRGRDPQVYRKVLGGSRLLFTKGRK